ncbi:MAG: UDP-glucose 4-epimerase [uncultured bacterium]|nr:MAG: UDP-glucose 4-epimerase [uncultured bacterium]
MQNIQRVLVTGGAGFIGSASVDLLLQQEKQVVVLDNLYSGKLENLPLQHPNLEFVEGDILEYSLVENLLVGCDAVLHLAAIPSVPFSIDNPIYTFQVNTQGFLHVLQAVHQAKRSIRLVYASSAAVYGDVKSLPCRDDELLTSQPLSPYALQKWQCEEYANLYVHLHQLPSLGLRYFNVYGLRQDPASPYSGVITRFLDAYHQEKELTVFGDGMQSRDFIHVSDVARANVFALQSHFAGAVNIATGSQETLLQLIDYISQAGKHAAQIEFQPARIGDIKESYAAVKLAEQHLGFKYTVSLKDGISRFFVTA